MQVSSLPDAVLGKPNISCFLVHSSFSMRLATLHGWQCNFRVPSSVHARYDFVCQRCSMSHLGVYPPLGCTCSPYGASWTPWAAPRGDLDATNRPRGGGEGGGTPRPKDVPPPVALRRDKADIKFTLLVTCSGAPWQGTWRCSKLTGSAALASAPILGTCTLPPP